jgi:hypothetical protein
VMDIEVWNVACVVYQFDQVSDVQSDIVRLLTSRPPLAPEVDDRGQWQVARLRSRPTRPDLTG